MLIVRSSHELLDKVDIIQVISRYTQLKKAGANFKALCPFHREKTPSFIVSPQRQIYKCFGCQEGGNAIKFVMTADGLGYYDACRRLAGLFNFEYRARGAGSEDNKISRLMRINKWAAQLYYKNLTGKAHNAASNYIRKRNISDTTVKKLQIGYADSNNIICKNFRKEGFSENDLLELGLIKRYQDRTYDMFFNRLVIPIKDRAGNVIGFGARALEQDQMPKYVNSRESILFKKHSVLFGVDLLKIKYDDPLYVCEGYFDVIMPYQSGMTCFSATLGTALTRNHARIIKRISNNVIILFDSDNAGRESVRNSIPLLYNENIDITICTLKKYKDPAEYIENNELNALKTELKNTQNPLDFLIASATNGKQFNSLPESKQIDLLNELISTSRSIINPIKKEIFLKAVSNKLNISYNNLRRGLYSKGERIPSEPEYLSGSEKILIQLLTIAVIETEEAESIANQLDELQIPQRFKNWFEILIKYIKSREIPPGNPVTNQINEIFVDTMDDNIVNMITEIAIKLDENQDKSISEIKDDCIETLKYQSKERSLKQIKKALKGDIDPEERRRILLEIQTIKTGMINKNS